MILCIRLFDQQLTLIDIRTIQHINSIFCVGHSQARLVRWVGGGCMDNAIESLVWGTMAGNRYADNTSNGGSDGDGCGYECVDGSECVALQCWLLL